MWKIFSCLCKFSKVVFRTLKCIICSKPVRWIIIVGTVGVSLCMLCNYLEKLMILELARMYAEDIEPVSASVVTQKLSYGPTNKISLVGWFWNTTEPPNRILDLNAILSTNEAQQSKRASQIMRFGYPGLDNIRQYNNYVLSYDRKNKIPHWVYEHLTSDFKYGDNSLDFSWCFPLRSDERIHPHFRSDITDYVGSGYFTRQLASVPNHMGSVATLREAFYLSSMVPQRGVSTKGDDCWSILEKRITELTENHSNVYACTGPIFLPRKEANGKTYVKYEVIGQNDVAVPTHIFKYVIGESKNRDLNLWCYLFENKVIEDVKSPLENFYVDPIALEKTSGLVFLRGLSLARFKNINGKPNPFLLS